MVMEVVKDGNGMRTDEILKLKELLAAEVTRRVEQGL